MKHSLTWLVAAVWLGALGCTEEITTPISAQKVPIPEEKPDSVVFSETVDLTVGSQIFHGVDIMGTLQFSVVPAPDSSDGGGARPYDVFISTDMRFRRSQDFTMTQRWTAGGKSGNRVMLEEGEMAILRKSYQVWSIPNVAYINIVFGVTASSVDVRIVWVSYEPILTDSYREVDAGSQLR